MCDAVSDGHDKLIFVFAYSQLLPSLHVSHVILVWRAGDIDRTVCVL